MPDLRHTRRDVLAFLGAAGLASLVAACDSTKKTGASNSAPAPGRAASTAGTAASGACLLSPEQTDGPFFIPGEAVRVDITEGTPGLPLRLAFVVRDVAKCAAVPNAAIDIWHADASGNYSGFNATAANRAFLRGIQVTDARGGAGFRTIYPGWYQGRATHIHVKVHVGGNVAHTGQLYFDDAISRAVYDAPPYRGRTGARTLNSQDGIYASGGAESTLRLTPDGSGYVGAITLGIKTT